MSTDLTRSQVNRLGDLLRKGQPRAADLEMLDAFRELFVSAYQNVIGTLRNLGLEPSGRIKTPISIVEKLKRESVRLSRLQDIAGCRVIVDGVADQERVVGLVKAAFPNTKVIDRRERPSHGYRAVHIIADIDEKLVEIQIRTELQQLWAVWSEALANAIDHSIKYGGGPSGIQEILALESEMIGWLESSQHMVAAGLMPPDKRGLLSASDAMSGKSLGPDLLAAALEAGTLADLMRHEQEMKDRLAREILKAEAKWDPHDFSH